MTALYILVDDRLNKSQRIPQAAHAAAVFVHEHGQVDEVAHWVKVDRTMVCLKADAETIGNVVKDGVRVSEFVDEDLDDMRTAIAVGPLDRETGAALFGHLQLA